MSNKNNYLKNWRKKNPDKVKKHNDKQYFLHKDNIIKNSRNWQKQNREKDNKTKEAYRNSEKGKQKHKIGSKIYRKKFPSKILAQRKIEYLFRMGYLQKEDCAICGSSEKIEAHHENYAEPYIIIWLCKKCHCKIHKKNRCIYEN